MYEEFKKISGLEEKLKFEYNDTEIDTDSVKRFLEKPEVTVIDMLCCMKVEISALSNKNEELVNENSVNRKLISDLKEKIEALQKQNAILKDEIEEIQHNIISTASVTELYKNQEKMMSQIEVLEQEIKSVGSFDCSNKPVNARGPVDLLPVATIEGNTVSQEFIQDLLTFPDIYRKDDEWIYYIHSDNKMYKVHYDGTNNQVIFNGKLHENCRNYRSMFSYNKQCGIITFRDSNGNNREIKVR